MNLFQAGRRAEITELYNRLDNRKWKDVTYIMLLEHAGRLKQ